MNEFGSGIYTFNFTTSQTLGLFTYSSDCNISSRDYFALSTYHVNPETNVTTQIINVTTQVLNLTVINQTVNVTTEVVNITVVNQVRVLSVAFQTASAIKSSSTSTVKLNSVKVLIVAFQTNICIKE